MARALFQHLDRCFPVHDKDFVDLGGHPLAARLPGLRIARIAPSYPVEPWVFLTVGAWAGQRRTRAVELLMLAPGREVHEALRLADAVQAGLDEEIEVGRVLPLSRPPLGRALVTLPYPYGPVLEQVEGAPIPTRYLWLCPIHSAEEALLGREGLEALELLLEGADFLDPKRPSVAPPMRLG